MTAVSYLRKSGGSRSALLNQEEQETLHWMKERVTLLPQFIMGKWDSTRSESGSPGVRFGVDSGSGCGSFPSVSMACIGGFVCDGIKLAPSQLLYLALTSEIMSLGTDALLQFWDNLQVYAVLLFVMVTPVLTKLRWFRNVLMMLIAPFWCQRDPLRQPHFHWFHQNLCM